MNEKIDRLVEVAAKNKINRPGPKGKIVFDPPITLTSGMEYTVISSKALTKLVGEEKDGAYDIGYACGYYDGIKEMSKPIDMLADNVDRIFSTKKLTDSKVGKERGGQ